MKIKAITIRQPWANLIARGLKTIETRTWKTNYRGPLAIHAGLAVDVPAANRFSQTHNIHFEPLGEIIAICELAEIRFYFSRKRFWKDEKQHLIPLDKVNFGTCYGWVLKNVESLPKSIPWRGMPGLFEVEV